MRYSKDINFFLVILFCLSFFSANLVHGLNDTEKKLFYAIRNQSIVDVKSLLDAKTIWGSIASGAFAADLNVAWTEKKDGEISRGDTLLMIAARCFQQKKTKNAFTIFQHIFNAKNKDGSLRVDLKGKNQEAVNLLKQEIEKFRLQHLLQAILDKKTDKVKDTINKENSLRNDPIYTYRVDLNGVNAGPLVFGCNEADTPALVAAKSGNFDAARLIFNAKNADGSYRVKRDTDQSKEAIKLIKKHFEDLYTKELFEAIRDSKDISVTLKKEFKLCDDIEPFRADLNRKNDLVVGIDKDKTPLFAATADGSPEMVQALVEAKSDKGEALIKMDVPENVEALRKVVETGSDEMKKAILTEKSLAPAFSVIVRQKIKEIEGDAASPEVREKYQAFLENCKSDLEVSLEGLQKKLGALKEKLGVLAGTLGQLKTSLGAA